MGCADARTEQTGVCNLGADMTTPILQMKKVEKRFPGVHALKGVDLEVHSGKVVALIGENGAGKSTLMKILGGVHQPDSGEILIDGQAVTIQNVSDATHYGIAFIHQELNVLDNLDVAANVFLGREPVYGGPLRLVDRRKMSQETQTLLNRLGLNISPETPLIRLSVAQQQLVEIAKALSLNARILIMDEPTSSLSLTESRLLLKVVDDLRAQGVAIIYISHRLREVEEIADCVVVMRDGANAGSLAREEISHDRMVPMMVGRDIESFYQEPIGENTPGYFEVEGLRLSRYPGSQVSFSVGKGEILGIAGLVGAGRSEMAQAIFGVDRFLDAKLRLNNEPITIRSSRDAIRKGIYLVPENRRQVGLITEISIRENLSLPALNRYSTVGLMVLERERSGAKASCEHLNVSISIFRCSPPLSTSRASSCFMTESDRCCAAPVRHRSRSTGTVLSRTHIVCSFIFHPY